LLLLLLPLHGLQTGDWVVLLEGICRISITGLAASHDHGSVDGSVSSVHGSSKASAGLPAAAAAVAAGGGGAEIPYDFVTIQQLELLPHAQLASNGSSSSSNGGGGGGSNGSNGGFVSPGDTSSSSSHPNIGLPGPLAPIDTALRNSGPGGLHNLAQGVADAISSSSSSADGSNGGDVEQLGAALKASTKLLLQMLSAASGLPAARRLVELLGGVPAWRAADVVAAALARTNQVCFRVCGRASGDACLEGASEVRMQTPW
jgi:hypothetical protein